MSYVGYHIYAPEDSSPYPVEKEGIVAAIFGGAGVGYQLDKKVNIAKEVGDEIGKSPYFKALVTGACPGGAHIGGLAAKESRKPLKELAGFGDLFLLGTTEVPIADSDGDSVDDRIKMHLELMQRFKKPASDFEERGIQFLEEQQKYYDSIIFPAYDPIDVFEVHTNEIRANSQQRNKFNTQLIDVAFAVCA
ncbi:MAG: hypothetical protein KKF44_08715 [Nanoarchaeota archaeon]|nr:hypothetical protein [Nanoarchaeota archaeon]